MSSLVYDHEGRTSLTATLMDFEDAAMPLPNGNADSVCDELLGCKMSNLELSDLPTTNYGDGSDSGVDFASTANITLLRALSNNSGGYTSSSGGLDETTHGLNVSCDSSMISCSSDLYDPKLGVNSGACSAVRPVNSYECCSENGSESSSIAGSAVSADVARKFNNVKKKVALFEPNHKDKDVSSSSSTKEQHTHTHTSARGRTVMLKRTASLPRPSAATSSLQTRAQEKPTINSPKAVTSTTPVLRAGQTRPNKPQKPDSLCQSLNRTQSMSMQRLVQRTPSLSRSRTPGTPSDDGRWPTIASPRVSNISAQTPKRGTSVAPDMASLKSRQEARTGSGAFNPYSTLPRRRKQKSVEDLSGGSAFSNCAAQLMSSSVIVTSGRKQLGASHASPIASTPTRSPSNTTTSLSRSVSARKAQPAKTRIYHETSVQTALTNDDIQKLFSGGLAPTRPVDAAEQCDQQAQTDMRDRELESLRGDVAQLTQRQHELTCKLQSEREEKEVIHRELQYNTQRVLSLLDIARSSAGDKAVGTQRGSITPTSDGGKGAHANLCMLESQIHFSGYALAERQNEIGNLRELCQTLQADMERSLAMQECLMQEKEAMELESSELHDFLQHEKAAMGEALKDLEHEYQLCKTELGSRDEEVKVLREECRHLVRLNEQRRQENRLWQTKYSALATKSKELIQQQNASTSGASAALVGLHERLDNLVEQLVSSYSISEQDLEDLSFQNEVNTTNGGVHADGLKEADSPNLQLNTHDLELQQPHLPQPSDGSLSPQRNQSFIAAVISAIRNATTPSGKKLLARHNNKLLTNQSINNNNDQHEEPHSSDSDSTEMLDSETEPCLMMDNVLEDVAMPDTHSHNMVSACTGVLLTQQEAPLDLIQTSANGDESLNNLSQAITNRQQMELQIKALAGQRDNPQLSKPDTQDSVGELMSLAKCCSSQAVVDQVIEVDGLVTKLLKVLRLIQMDNDSCIQQLIVDKNKLQQNKEDMLEKLKDLEDENMKLQDELMDATQELMAKTSDLSSSKAEIQRHRNKIDRLTEDICNLSTLCTHYRKLSPSTEFPPSLIQEQLLASDEEPQQNHADGDGNILQLLKQWQTEQSKQNKCLSNAQDRSAGERLRIYANQLENVTKLLDTCDSLKENVPALQQLRHDIEIVKLHADWSQLIAPHSEDLNANNADGTTMQLEINAP